MTYFTIHSGNKNRTLIMSTANQFRDFEPINHEKPAVLMEKTFDKKCEIIFNCDVRVKGDILFKI